MLLISLLLLYPLFPKNMRQWLTGDADVPFPLSIDWRGTPFIRNTMFREMAYLPTLVINYH